MKKTVCMLTAAAGILLISCGGKKEESKEAGGGMSEMTKKNMATSEAIGKMFQTKDFSKLADYLSPDFVDYSAMEGPAKGIEANKKSFEQMANMTDSSSMETITATGNDEYTMTWMKMKGKMKVDAMGMKAGQWMEGKSVEVTQFNKEGKAIAHWSYMDPADMMKMMGAMPPPPPPMEKK